VRTRLHIWQVLTPGDFRLVLAGNRVYDEARRIRKVQKDEAPY
jgi:hypothetical protein